MLFELILPFRFCLNHTQNVPPQAEEKRAPLRAWANACRPKERRHLAEGSESRGGLKVEPMGGLKVEPRGGPQGGPEGGVQGRPEGGARMAMGKG